ncbi:hypothetical protein [Ruegeria arenilitoris]|uniref:hypothetical protein n=1 Tax=Ruegeria arenilitoris TaxID=1173585 RepID=UPI00147BA74A|nr:hypothetical protein [Ruegeria arenilitoris]
MRIGHIFPVLFQWDCDTTRLGQRVPKIRSIAQVVMNRLAVALVQYRHFGAGLGYKDA